MKRNSSSSGPRPARIPPTLTDTTGQQPVKVGSPAEVLAAVPYLIGFHPARSLIVIGARAPRDRIHVTFRYDLPDPPQAGYASEIVKHATAVLVSQRVTVAVVAGYGPGRLVTPLAEQFRARLAAAGIDVREVLRVENCRYWS